jgi:hypothetical protein
VGIAAAIFKDGGKGGNPDVGFPGFPQAGISTCSSIHLQFQPPPEGNTQRAVKLVPEGVQKTDRITGPYKTSK